MSYVEILARHFSQASGVAVLFEENATPTANVVEKVIVLPSNLDPTCEEQALAWLMHESGHIRWSTPADLNGRNFLHPYLNALEDIRIDLKIFREYPEALESVFLPSDRRTTGTENYWRALKRPAKLLVALNLKGEGLDCLIPDDADIRGFFGAHKEKLQEIVKSASAALASGQNVPLAMELATLILGEDAMQMHEQIQQKTQAAADEVGKAAVRIVNVKKERVSLERRIAYRRKKLEKIPDNKSNRETRQNISKEIKKIEEECGRNNEKEAALAKECLEKQSQLQGVLRELDENDKALIERAGVVPGRFDLDKSSLTYRPSTPLCKSFDDLLLEKLRSMQTRTISQGSRLNRKKLHAVYTRPETVFVGQPTIHARWKRLYFLLDCSPSMMAGQKAQIVLSAMEQIALALERCRRKAGASDELKYEIWLFNDSAWKIKGADERFTKATLSKYLPDNSTELGQALNTLTQAIKRNAAFPASDNVLFCLTDAELAPEDVQAAKSFSAGRAIFLGIGAQLSRAEPPEIRRIREQLFLRHNIHRLDILEKVLREAILRELNK